MEDLIRGSHLQAVRLGRGYIAANSGIFRFYRLATKMRRLGVAVAPIVRVTRAPRRVPPRVQGASLASAAMRPGASARSPAGGLAKASPSQVRIVSNVAARPSAFRASFSGHEGAARYGVLARAVVRSGNRRIGLAAGLVHVANSRVEGPTSVSGKFGFARVDLLNRQRLAVLPSLAPVGVYLNDVRSAGGRVLTAMGGETSSAKNSPMNKGNEQTESADSRVVSSTSILPRPDKSVYSSGETRTTQARSNSAQSLSPASLERALSDFFRRQSRLPPAGMTAFDPRLTPAWPSLKLPG